MNWNYHPYANNSMQNVIDDMERAYNFDADEVASAKVAISNLESGDARGVIFYNHAIQWPAQPRSSTYRAHSITTNGNYDDLYRQACQFLDTLDNERAFFARASMSNLRHGACWMVIWYPI